MKTKDLVGNFGEVIVSLLFSRKIDGRYLFAVQFLGQKAELLDFKVDLLNEDGRTFGPFFFVQSNVQRLRTCRVLLRAHAHGLPPWRSTMSAAGGLAISLVSLALARKGFRCARNVMLPNGANVDLLATASDPKLGHQSFVIAFQAVEDEDRLPTRIDRILEDYAQRLGIGTHIAFFIDSSDTLIVDKGLAEHMQFSDPDVKLKTINPKSQSNPSDRALPTR